MSEPIVITEEIHKRIAVDLLNQTWDLIDKDQRTDEETRTLVNSAHASLYHRRRVGTPLVVQRGEWLIARVYTLLGAREAAKDHAGECLRLPRQLPGQPPAIGMSLLSGRISLLPRKRERAFPIRRTRSTSLRTAIPAVVWYAIGSAAFGPPRNARRYSYLDRQSVIGGSDPLKLRQVSLQFVVRPIEVIEVG